MKILYSEYLVIDFELKVPEGLITIFTKFLEHKILS